MYAIKAHHPPSLSGIGTMTVSMTTTLHFTVLPNVAKVTGAVAGRDTQAVLMAILGAFRNTSNLTTHM